VAFLTGRRAFLELLKQEGVEVMFGNPGTTELPLMDALAVDDGMRYVLGLQEAAVLAMADGYAQASGKLGVVNVHVAPGLGNAMGMLYDAQKAGAPLLVTAGQHDQSFTFGEPILWADLPTIARPFVKWSAEVRRLAELPAAVHRAAKTALAPPTGPVFLSLPSDVLMAEGEIELGAPTRVGAAIRGDAAAIAKAAALLAEAENPVIMAGDAVAQGHALPELAALAEALGAPVYAELIPNTASFPATHRLFRGALPRSQKAVRDTLERHDLLLSVGADLFTWSLPAETVPVPEDLTIVQIDTDPWELGKNHPAAAAIFGAPKATLPELTERVLARYSESQRQRTRSRGDSVARDIAGERETLRARARDEGAVRPMRALALLGALAEALPPDAVIVDETISSGAGLRQLLKNDDAQSFYGMRGGGIGWGLPAAVGIKVALPDRPVVALVGDGSAMYTIQALWTAAHERLRGLVFVILNNGSYRILKQRTNLLRGHAAQTGRYVGMDLRDPAVDFPALAGALGVAARRAETPEAVAALVREGITSDVPLLVEAIIDPAL
jgi:benzoylformate decarboxylase